MHSIVISVESMSMATTRTRSRVRSGGNERMIDAGRGAQLGDPGVRLRPREPEGLERPAVERVNALRAGERRDRRDVGGADRGGLDDEIHPGTASAFGGFPARALRTRGGAALTGPRRCLRRRRAGGIGQREIDLRGFEIDAGDHDADAAGKLEYPAAALADHGMAPGIEMEIVAARAR